MGFKIHFAIAVLLWGLTSSAFAADKSLVYCIRTPVVDFYPFKRMENNNVLETYLLLLRSYRSNDDSRILEKMSILPRLNKMSAVVSRTAIWQDGTPVSSREAALGIAKGLTTTPTGQHIQVVGTEKINEPGWQHRDYEGVRIIDDRHFELIFDSSVANLAGGLNEVLGAGTRYNRLWPARLSKIKSEGDGYRAGEWDAVTHYPVSRDKNGSFTVHYQKEGKQYDILLSHTSGSHCDFYCSIVGKYKYEDQFVTSRSHEPQTVLAIPNLKRLPNIEDRRALAQLLRASFLESEKQQFIVVDGHFVNKEIGRTRIKWPNSIPDKLSPRLSKELHLALWVPKSEILTRGIEKIAKKFGVKVTWYYSKDHKEFLAKRDLVDAYVMVDHIRDYSQSWIRDINSFEVERYYIDQFAKTNKVLRASVANSVVNDYTDASPLHKVEEVLYEEISIIPLARFYLDLFSKKKAPLRMVYNSNGEIHLRKKDEKREVTKKK